jgi:hypothetical protein
MPMLAKVIYRFNAIASKFHYHTPRNRGIKLKSHMKSQKTLNSQSNLEQKRNASNYATEQ